MGGKEGRGRESCLTAAGDRSNVHPDMRPEMSGCSKL